MRALKTRLLPGSIPARIAALLLSQTLLLALPGTAFADPETVSRIGYAIQVGAFTEVKNAEKLAAVLQQKGIEAFYFKNERGFYVVRFGDFRSKGDARAQAENLTREKVVESYFITPPAATAPAPVPGQPPAGETAEAPAVPETVSGPGHDIGSIAARTAERFIGLPYRWGGNTVVEGLDCSGFTRAVYHLCGVSIPRTAAQQFKIGRPVGRDELKDGDLVFFSNGGGKISHVGIYVGNARFVHAPRRGQDIMISPLSEETLSRKYAGARRCL